MKKLSLIVPSLDEATTIVNCLAALQEARARGHEVILVDGGSSDGTPVNAAGLADRIVTCARGRARQMNYGAGLARGDVLVFVHADTVLPRKGLEQLSELQAGEKCWGRFDVRLSGSHPLFRLIESGMNLRSRITGIATGDQALFVGRELFEAVGGFPSIELMEDITLSSSLKKIAPPLCLRTRVVTSSRRWERQGILRTILRMMRLRACYALGVKPDQLAREYDAA